MHILITRPEEDAGPLAAALQAHGVETRIEPLMRVVDLEGPPLDLGGVQAVLATSANGVRAFARRESRRDLPLLAVGDATARAAEAAGFRRVEAAAGHVEALAELVASRLHPTDGDLLHVAGTTVAGDLAGMLRACGYAVRRAVLYEARPVDRLSWDTLRALGDAALDGVALYSPRTAALFVDLAISAGVADCCRHLIAFCLSEAVAAKARGLAWRSIVVADRADQTAMIAAVLGAAAGRDEDFVSP